MFWTIVGYDQQDVQDVIDNTYSQPYKITEWEFKRIMDNLETLLANNQDFQDTIKFNLLDAIRQEL